MSFSRPALLALLFLGLGGCGKQTVTPSRPTLLAILPFENLSGAADWDWLSRAAPVALTEELQPDSNLRVIQANSKRDADLAGATEYLYGAIERHQGALRMSIWRESSGAADTLQTLVSDAQGQQVLPLLADLTRKLAGRAAPFSTTNEEAFRQFGLGLTATTPEAATEAWRKATELDPTFGTAYDAWALNLSNRGDRKGAAELLERAKPALPKMQPAARARLEMLDGMIRGDVSKQADALRSVAAASPTDATAQAAAGEKLAQAKRYGEAISAFQASLKINPNQGNVLNLLGYSQAYTKDFPGAKASLEKVVSLSPQDPNGYDSLGEIHYFFGKFAEASHYFEQAFEKNNAFLNGTSLEKAAIAWLMAGEAGKARDDLRRYFDARKVASDPLLSLRQAQWDYILGRKKQALESLKPQGSDAAQTLIHAQRALWFLDASDAQSAQNEARAAVGSAKGGPSQLLASIAFFVSQNVQDGAAWRSLAQRVYPQPQAEPLRRTALAYAFLLHGLVADATPLWKQLDAETTQSPLYRPNVVPCASLLVRSDRWAEAREALSTFAVPQFTEDDLFRFIRFPEELKLRAAIAKNAGNATEAARWQGAYDASQK